MHDVLLAPEHRESFDPDPGDAPGQLFPFGCEGNSGFAWGEVAMQFFIESPEGMISQSQAGPSRFSQMMT